MRNYSNTCLLLTICLFGLAGCESLSVISDTSVDDQSEPTREVESSAQAKTDILPPLHILDLESGDSRLLAANNLIKNNQLDEASQLLKTVDIDELDLTQATLYRLLLAQIALAERQPALALSHLGEPDSLETPLNIQVGIYRTRIDAYTLMGKTFDAVSERVLLEPLLDSQAEVQQNHDAIWHALATMTPESLSRQFLELPPGTLSGWLELAYIYNAYRLQATTMRGALLDWQQRYPQHPATPTLLMTLLNWQPVQTSRAQHIVMLLPLTSRFGDAAAAVRDGFLAAYYADKSSENRPTIQIYDSTSSNIWALYQQAVKEGADIVIGPLAKDSVNTLASAGELMVPVLALNYAETSARLPENLFQFGLSPEDEAQQVAKRIWLDGHSQGLAIVPETPWGDRVFNAFRKQWSLMGGSIVETQTYDPRLKDFSKPISRLLNIDESKTRRRFLKRVLKSAVKFVPHRRQDVDFIFMAGFPAQSRQIYPQLKFFHAGKLPVYATSHVFSGKLDKNADRDMDGVMFGDMPWVLDPDQQNSELKKTLDRNRLNATGTNIRLHALGIDTYHLIPYLNLLHSQQHERFSGKTGSLRIDEYNRIRRQLYWGLFSGGKPKSLDLLNAVPVSQWKPKDPDLPNSAITGKNEHARKPNPAKQTRTQSRL